MKPRPAAPEARTTSCRPPASKPKGESWLEQREDHDPGEQRRRYPDAREWGNHPSLDPGARRLVEQVIAGVDQDRDPDLGVLVLTGPRSGKRYAPQAEQQRRAGSRQAPLELRDVCGGIGRCQLRGARGDGAVFRRIDGRAGEMEDEVIRVQDDITAAAILPDIIDVSVSP